MIIHNHGNYIRHFGEALLIPGANQLDPALSESFKKALKNPLNQKLVDAKEIEVVKAANTSQTGTNSISDIAADEAILLVSDTFDVTLLENWLEEESAHKNRKTVVSAIENQIDDIKNPNPENVVDPQQ